MKAIEEYFPVVVFVILYEVILTFESVQKKVMSCSFQWHAGFLSCILTFESMDEILNCHHSNERYWAVLSRGAVYYAVQVGSNVWFCGWNSKVWPFKWKLLSNAFLQYWLLRCTMWYRAGLEINARKLGRKWVTCKPKQNPLAKVCKYDIIQYNYE